MCTEKCSPKQLRVWRTVIYHCLLHSKSTSITKAAGNFHLQFFIFCIQTQTLDTELFSFTIHGSEDSILCVFTPTHKQDSTQYPPPQYIYLLSLGCARFLSLPCNCVFSLALCPHEPGRLLIWLLLVNVD